MSDSALQISLFAEKIPVDKNFSFSTQVATGQLAYKIDLEKSYEERPEQIIDLFNFLSKRYYDSPLVNQPFTHRDYCHFLGKSLRAFQAENVIPNDQRKHYDNQLERLLYKLVNRNLVRESTYFVPSKKKRIEKYEAVNLLSSYEKVSQDQLRDKRTVEYVANLNDFVKDNISSFLFYTTTTDYRILLQTYYRNPNYRFLYMRLSNLLNNLKGGITDTISFDELSFLLGYQMKEPKHTRQKIEASLKKMLALESLTGLSFHWGSNGNGYSYLPVFQLRHNHQDNQLTESRHDKYKRLDLLVLTRMRKILPETRGGKFSYMDVRLRLKESPELYDILVESYLAVMKKEPSGEQLGSFYDHYLYTDDHKNGYASNLVRHIIVNGEPLSHDSIYQGKVTQL